MKLQTAIFLAFVYLALCTAISTVLYVRFKESQKASQVATENAHNKAIARASEACDSKLRYFESEPNGDVAFGCGGESW